MEIKHIISHVKYLMSLTPECDFERNMGHAVEELGEVSKANRNLRYAVRRFDSNDPATERAVHEAAEHLIEETVDLAVTAFATYLAAGGKPDEFYSILMRKCSKWENNVKPKEVSQD